MTSRPKEIKALIVDDEESAQNVLKNLITRFCPTLQIIGISDNLPDAVESIKTLTPDVVFLDIEMPNYRGIEIVDFFDEIPFHIVFITAYDQYAIKAFEMSAFDYLLKPIHKNRLIELMQKLEKQMELQTAKEKLDELSQSFQQLNQQKISITDKGYKRLIETENILALEAQEAYCKIHLIDEPAVIVSHHLKHYESLLGENKRFIRTHKSWIINTQFLKSYSKSRMEIVLENDLYVKLSRYRKIEFEQALKKNNIM